MMGKSLLACVAALLLVSAASAVRLGGIERATPDEDHIKEVAAYAVEQITQQTEYDELSLSKILTARKQIVAGAIYFLTLEASEPLSDAIHTFEVAVYEPFGSHTNTLKLTHFKEAHAQTARMEPNVEDTQLLHSVAADGAAAAVRTLSQQSNSLIPWTLQEVVGATQVSSTSDELPIYQLTFSASRGQEEKVFKVNMRLSDGEEWTVLGSFSPVVRGAAQ